MLSRLRTRRILSVLVQGSALGAMLLAGCDTKGFVDPTEMGRYKKDSLVLPIVSQVDPAVEEVDSNWARATVPTAEDLASSTGEYRISPNDLLAISLSDINGPNTETVKQSRVNESGDISLPYLDQPIHAVGLTEIQLEHMIIDAYRGANIIQHAQVSVTVVEARGRAFSVWGSVNAPGEYAIVESDFRLMNALVLARNVISPFVENIYIVRRILPPTTAPSVPVNGAGPVIPAPATGPSSDELAPKSDAGTAADPVAAAKTERVLHLAADGASAGPNRFDGFRDPTPEQNVRVIRIPYEALRRGDLKYNITIRPKDVIYVSDPQTGFYYVGGHSARPGAYTFTGQKVTLKDAIISAGMLDGLAIPQRTDVIRHVNPDHEVYVRVDLAKIFSGEEPDIYLKPGDKVMVGTNALAPFLAAIRGGFRITYGFGFLYDRNYAYPVTTGGVP